MLKKFTVPPVPVKERLRAVSIETKAKSIVRDFRVGFKAIPAEKSVSVVQHNCMGGFEETMKSVEWGSFTITPDEARELAAALLEIADYAEGK